MGDEVNQAAFEGGDTEEETKAAIASRNEAMQSLKDQQDEVAERRSEVAQDEYDNQIAAEREVAESTNALVTGQPVVTPPAPPEPPPPEQEG